MRIAGLLILIETAMNQQLNIEDLDADALKAEGIAVPDGITVRVVENTAQDVSLEIPARPTDVPDETLGAVVGGRTGQSVAQGSSQVVDGSSWSG